MPDWPGRQEWGKRRGDQAIKGLAYFNDYMKGRSFVALDRYSMPDITLYIALLFADIAGLPIAPELTTLRAWAANIEDIPAVKNRTGKTILPGDLDRLGK